MATWTRIVALLLLWLPLVFSYSWTPISSDQSFPLPEVRSPDILPDPDDGAQAAFGNASSALDSRSLTSFVSDGSVQPWPIRGILRKRNRIRYCFATAEMKEKIGCRLSEAIALWDEALGGGAGKVSGHNLAFSEARFGGIPQLCFKDFYYTYWNGKRNKLVANDVLAVYLKDEASSGGVSSATAGYIPKERVSADQLRGFRHQLTIAENAPSAVIAHEIGHVMGLMHEHKRPDRDDFVDFRCKKLKGFGSAMITAHAKPENSDLTLEDIGHLLCTDRAFADQNQFEASQFIRITDNEDSHTEFDFDSIMMYGSGSFALDSCHENALDQCPLVKIKKENGVKVDEEYIHRSLRPSEGDAAFVKKYYPWNE
ncbi:hypothetical protein P171DRAFT_521818 [Karstenula rhodostoma CBS 690.94]|uniref:Metalloendopeptidase n=1 Tax=Karstenula rhodostoma CBS 690.94 TaxID=1392251 RepID=A0A9P4UBR9_9PLEO|nr:hypothetical protein P171DRAFT_521818 [Karstenula rhodostoma CBS 690.94]